MLLKYFIDRRNFGSPAQHKNKKLHNANDFLQHECFCLPFYCIKFEVCKNEKLGIYNLRLIHNRA